MMRAVRVVDEVRGDPEEIVPSVGFALVNSADAEEAIVGFLEQILGELLVSRPTPQIDPERSGRSLVEGMEGLLVHLKCVVEDLGLEPIEF